MKLAEAADTHTVLWQNTLIVLLPGGGPPQADYSAEKAIRHYCPITSQIIMGGAPRSLLAVVK